MDDRSVTISRADLAPAAERIAQTLGLPAEGVEHALWAWARQSAALLVADAYTLALAPDSSGGFCGAIFRGALALWLQERRLIGGRSLLEYPAEGGGLIFPDDQPI